jgi:hypothetical protein
VAAVTGHGEGPVHSVKGKAALNEHLSEWHTHAGRTRRVESPPVAQRRRWTLDELYASHRELHGGHDR